VPIKFRSNISFDNIDDVSAQVRDQAIQDAKSKATELSRSLGIHLGKIVNFEESGNGGPIMYGKAMSADVNPQVPVGENTVTSQVTITYEVD
jgi:uncharacterized protein YggE